MDSERRKEAYDAIARGMRAEGYNRTVKQIKKKITDLRYTYRKIKDSNGRSGRGRATWDYYDLIDAFLGDRHASAPAHLVETMPEEDEDESDGSDADIDVDTVSIRGPTPPPDVEDGNVMNRDPSSASDISEETPGTDPDTSGEGNGVRTTDKGKKSRLQAAMSELSKTMTTLQEGNKKEETEAERMRAEHELKMLKMQQEHELKMMGQFMTVMAGFFGNPQRYPAPTPNFQVPETTRLPFNAQQPPQFTNTLHFPASSSSRGPPPPLHYPTPLRNNNNPMYQGCYSPLQQPSTSFSHPSLSQGPQSSTPSSFTQGLRCSTPNTSTQGPGPRTSTPLPTEQQWHDSNGNVEEDEPTTYFSL
ncbi:hypothetical protein Bbelb_317900 [Branchiostoma belcheri]|nr:hypothetical protein Bbelb_317900 [Branchiostoma belcheri]